MKSYTVAYTVVPLLKDTLERGHLSRKDTHSWQQELGMHVMLPLTKGHLSNKEIISWQKGCPYQRDYCTMHIHQLLPLFTYISFTFVAPIRKTVVYMSRHVLQLGILIYVTCLSCLLSCLFVRFVANILWRRSCYSEHILFSAAFQVIVKICQCNCNSVLSVALQLQHQICLNVAFMLRQSQCHQN